MSILVAIKTPSAIILASDSRFSLVKTYPDGRRESCQIDWGQKVFLPGPPLPGLAIGFYGGASSGIRGVVDLTREWAAGIGQRLEVAAAAQSLHTFLGGRLGESCVVVAGYDGTSHFGRVFELTSSVKETHVGSTGLTVGGQNRVALGLLGTMQLPLEMLSSAGASELARFIVDTEIRAQSWNVAFAGVGGAVQIARLERGRAAEML